MLSLRQSTTPFLLLLLLITLLARIHGDSSTGIDSSTGVDESSSGPADSSSGGSTGDHSSSSDTLMSSAGVNSSSSSSTGSGPPKEYLNFPHFVCGQQEVNQTQGYYPDGVTPWEDPNAIDYLDSPDNTTVVPRGYPQCFGQSVRNNCFERSPIGKEYHGATAKQVQGNYCNNFSGTNKFVKGDVSPPICVVFGGGNRLWKMNFFPKVDQFALLTVQNSFATNASAAPVQFGHWGTSFHVEVNGQISEYRHRYGKVESSECVDQIVNGTRVPCTFSLGAVCTVVPFHTIIINLNNGVIDDISFDDDCSLCGNDYCVDGNCAQEVTKCTSQSLYDATNTASLTDCDFKVYVSWSGTDADGVYLSSSGRRLSQFRRWSLNAVYNQASDFDTGSIPITPPSQYD